MSFLIAWQHRFRDPRKQLEKSGVEEGQSVLGFGCGPRHYTVSAARTVGEEGMVYALDIHPLAIRAVENKSEKEKLANITTIL
ncbi:methyltransferase domain-containing protein [Chloroflexota bacterium]